MIDSVEDRDPVEQLADEFASRLREGETPSIAEYSRRYPQYAEQIEQLFPAVAVMERYRCQEESQRRSGFRAGHSAVPEFLGDFRIVREIGRGGMGIVYEAEQQSLARRVALKVLPKHALLLEKDRRRFEREAQTAANLHHTHIVPVFGTGVHDGLHYYVMPLVRGKSLDEIIAELQHHTKSSSPGREHWAFAARVGVQAAEALDYAHRQGTLHRDVKPSNLLISEHGEVSVADFGLARAIDPGDVSHSGEVVGTPRFVAPEQLLGKPEVRSDVYSLGLTLYELVTLRPAFDPSSGRLHDVVAWQRPEPVRPRKVNPSIPRDLETVLLKCLEFKPERRYKDAAALGEDLQRFLDGRPIRARHVTWAERSVRWCRRNPALASLSGVAALLLVAIVLTALAGHLRTRKAYEETTVALHKAEATSRIALEALDDIFLQLSPDRFWIQSGIDARGEACVCLGLRSGGPPASGERTAMQLHASEETAALMKGLLVCYDRLAEQGGDNHQVQLQSATACRRIGDIRQLLGQLAEAEREYGRAIEKLTALQATQEGVPLVALELARTFNGLGNIKSIRLDSGAAYAAHCKALAAIQKAGRVTDLPPECRYETARTLYFLANKATVELPNRRGEETEGPLVDGRPYSSRQCREAATNILEDLVRENRNVPDYQFLLALCLRPTGTDALSRTDVVHRRRAVTILEELKLIHPDVLDYRYELAATYAWVGVGFFPWQRPVAEPHAGSSLGMALAESRWLMEQNPSIPQYACSTALILAKLAEIRARVGEYEKAEPLFRQALEIQETAIAHFSELPRHHQVLCEFMRTKLAQTMLKRCGETYNCEPLEEAKASLETSVARLTQLAEHDEIADDRLAEAALPMAYETLRDVVARLQKRGQDSLILRSDTEARKIKES
ncbi:MAG: serine/threonine protein kinase [Planctomycetaceae bacterium]|nr:serine/threonine protein kinase [Planctomycetaceae bacterium]